MNITKTTKTHINLFLSAAIFATAAFMFDMSAADLVNSHTGSEFQVFTSQFPQELLAWL